MLQSETSVVDVAKSIGCSAHAVNDIMRNIVQYAYTTAACSGPRRPRVACDTTDDRHIVLRHLRNRFVIITSTRNGIWMVFAQKIRIRLRSAHLHAMRLILNPFYAITSAQTSVVGTTPLDRKRRVEIHADFFLTK